MVAVQIKSVLLWTLLSIAFASAKIQYGIMIDAGSSGSRLEIYSSVDEDGVLEVSEVAQVSAEPHKAEPGLASFADHPDDIDAYLQPLLDAAQKAIPEDHHGTTPIFLMGTAGMRLLSEGDQNVVLDEVVDLFSDKEKCPFKFKPSNARVITGQWEGIYAWITVNFLEGIFAEEKRATAYGTLDLGGASHQNTFETHKKRLQHETLELGGRDYKVFSRTYLGYGQDQAREKFQTVLVEGSGCSDTKGCEIENPCQFKGYKEVIDIDRVEYNFIGTADIKECRSIIKTIFFCKKKNSEECPFHDQPPLKGPFIGISAFYYVLNGIGMLESTNIVTSKRVSSASKSYCKLSYDDVNDDPFAHNNCFGANYIYELLTDGYAVHARKKITVESSLNGFDIGWTLGAILYEADLL